ncbi:MAG: hypothetical protein G01um101417_100 [Parcubacteria group bacterium Gr01-1014_17]|nr:MAG: hypothetical protein G01um101417_100 [Parcubacteria group bacterium Gr01-1014_17]
MERGLLDASFWKFLAGFAAMLAISFSVIVAVGYYEVEVKGKNTPDSVRATPVDDF